MEKGELCFGTVDAFLVYRLTRGQIFKTDYSNASRTQLMNLTEGKFEKELCDIFGIRMECLPQIEDSDGDYGKTDLEGFLYHPIPIRTILGDSHAALFGQGCLKKRNDKGDIWNRIFHYDECGRNTYIFPKWSG